VETTQDKEGQQSVTDDVVDLLLVGLHAVHILLQGGQLARGLAGAEPVEVVQDRSLLWGFGPWVLGFWVG